MGAIAVLALSILAQAQGHWVDLTVCRIDYVTNTSKSSGHSIALWVTADHEFAVADIYPKPEGVECVEIFRGGNKIYVVGAMEEIKRKLGP